MDYEWQSDQCENNDDFLKIDFDHSKFISVFISEIKVTKKS